MQVLNLKNTGKSLTLLAAGALMATLIAVPLAGNASANDDGLDDGEVVITVESTTPTFTLVDRDGNAVDFTLINNGVGQVLTLVEDVNEISNPFPDDESGDD